MNKKQELDKDTNIIEAHISGSRVIANDSSEARIMYDQSRFGELKDGKIKYSFVEALYLLDKGKLILYDIRKRKIDFDSFVKNATKTEKNFWIRYCVFRDMRSRGYIVKTALKFGADFRVYERGIKPGEDHAKWVIYPVHESSVFSWHEFAAKNRVAHSTRKRLLIGIVDDEDDTTYYEINWKKP
jgi:tRNA-intron endonuclease, archaea type